MIDRLRPQATLNRKDRVSFETLSFVVRCEKAQVETKGRANLGKRSRRARKHVSWIWLVVKA
jgi:hypothetical protein